MNKRLWYYLIAATVLTASCWAMTAQARAERPDTKPEGTFVAHVTSSPSGGPTSPGRPLPGVNDALDRIGKTVFVGRAEPDGPLLAADPQDAP